MKKLRLLLALFVASIGAVQSAWARIAPTQPEAQTLESGKIYYLYNVGADRFLTNCNSDYYNNVYVLTYSGSPIKISAINGTEYTMQFTNSSYYVEDWGGNDYIRQEEYWDNEPFRFTFTKIEGGYLIQRVYNSVETEYWGYNGNDDNRLYSNLTDGNVVWKLMDADEAARFIPKRNLYRALESSNGYNVDRYEAIYQNEESSNEAIQEAADELNKALEISNNIEKPDWNEYRVLISEVDEVESWEYSSSYMNSYGMYGSTTSINATVKVDDDATMAFTYRHNPGYTTSYLELYLDNVLQYTINGPQGYNTQRYFVEMTPGVHQITWKYTNTDTYNGGYCRISEIGVMRTPTILVSLKEPGSLGTEVLAQTDHVQNVRKLIISGEMNDEDWARILMMTNLFSLDLTDAEVTEIPDGQLSRYEHSSELSFLHEVKLPKTLKKIGKNAFRETYLDTIILPDGLTSIGEQAFYNSRIREAMIPETVTSIGKFAFYECKSLERASYPAAAVSIPAYCFYNCYSLQPFEIPEGITTIEYHAFENCNLFSSNLPSTLLSIGDEAFRSSGMVSAIISEDAIVGGYAFSHSKLTTAVLPTSLYDEVYEMMSYCDNLADVTFKSPTMVNSLHDKIFKGCSMQNITLHVPDYLVNTYKLDSYWYNCNVVGFNTADVTDWKICQPLKMSNGQRFKGTPNVIVTGAGTWQLSGDDAMTLNNFTTDFYNDYSARFVENQTSQILSTCDNITIEGDYKHRYHTSEKCWYFITLPFDAKVSDIECPCSFAIRYYDGANRAENGTGGNWKNYQEDDLIPAGTGFIFQTSKEVWTTFKAQNNDSKQRVFSNEMITTNLQVNASERKENKGWNLVGNPWVAYYNIHKMNFTAPITTWNPYYGTYTAYSVFDDDYAIKPLEAFFVQCPGEELTSIEFPVDGRQLTSVIESQNASRPAQASERKIIDLELSNSEQKDKTRFVLNPQASIDYETTCDASKFMSMDVAVPQIWTEEQGVRLAINERPQGNGTVQIGVKLPQDGEYTISAPRNQFQNIVLVDKEAGIETELSNDGSYTFTATAGTDNGRFVLRVGGTVITGVQVFGTEWQQTEHQVYNLNGQRIVAPKKGLYIMNGKKVLK